MAGRKQAIVMFPSPVIGHLVSMVELAKLIQTSQPSLSIHILIATPPYQSSSITSFIASVSAGFTFHHLPEISLPQSTAATSSHHEILTIEVLRRSTHHVRRSLQTISEEFNVRALVMDFFCFPAISVAQELKIPGYFFFTSGVGCLGLLSYLSTLHKITNKSFKDLNGTLIEIPGLPPIPSSEMPRPLMERSDKVYEYFLGFSETLPKSAGLIVNSFDALEKRALGAISDGRCSPETAVTPPIYCIGPLIVADNGRGSGARTNGAFHHECLSWLDSQPRESVVFLCFGSLGLFSKKQLHEIAIGLEKSGQRFLWVVRNPPSQGQDVAVSGLLDPNLNELLPSGFLDRTKDQGFVVKSWAPQIAVLNHDSVGGFVTHCGWNSVLESVSAGIPMVAWPLYAEQRLNKVLMVEEMKIALGMNEFGAGFVSREEVAERVKELMDSEEGESVRKRVKKMKAEAKAALGDGGSSQVALTRLAEKLKHI